MKEDKIYQIFYKGNIIQPLKGFCTTVEEGCSMLRASDKLYLTGPTIVRQIQALEQKLKVKLFKRSKVKVNGACLQLTEDGKKFYDKAKNVIKVTDSLFADYIEEKEDKDSKTLNIATNSAILPQIIPYITEYKKQNKNISLNIKVYTQNEALQLLLENKIDIFISSLEDNEKIEDGLKFEELSKYIPYWVLYKGHPLANKKSEEITKDDIIKSDLIFNYRDITMSTLKTLIDSYGIKSSININDYGLEGQKLLIKNELGIWLIFDIYLNKEDKEQLIFKNAKNMFPTGKCGCFTRRQTKNIAEEFIKSLVLKKNKIFVKNF